MKKLYRCLLQTLALFAIACLVAPPAHAYLDPGSGSMVVQLLLAGFAGVAVGLKLFWRRILAWFGLKKEGRPSDEQ